jgi:Lipocalin-like domain
MAIVPNSKTFDFMIGGLMIERNTELHGSWRLVSFSTELQNSKERTQPWGAYPNGHLSFSSDGRMMVLVTATMREPGSTDEKMVALFRTMMAYTGRYRIDGGRFITTIDSCWNEAWNGTEQERFYKLDGDTLEVSTAWMPNPLVHGNPIGRGILGFVRE